MLLGLLLAAACGLLAGSLLQFVVERRLAGGSPLAPPPQCPHCARRLAPRDLIPVVSWLRLRGRCRACEAPIARRHLLVEALAGLLFAAVVPAHRGDGSEIVLGLALAAVLVALALLQLDGRRPPDVVLAGAGAAAVALGLLVDAAGEDERLIAAVAAAAFVLLAALALPRATDMDAVKLAAVLGLFLGREVAAAVLIAVAAGVAARIAGVRRDDGERPWPRARAGLLLTIGGACALLIGTPLVDAYLDAF